MCSPGPYSHGVRGFESVSTWRQPLPPVASAARAVLVADVAARVARLGAGRLRVAVDGFTAAGKTSFGHESTIVHPSWAGAVAGGGSRPG